MNFFEGQLTIIFLLEIFEDIGSKLEKIGPICSSFNPLPSLPSPATVSVSYDSHFLLY